MEVQADGMVRRWDGSAYRGYPDHNGYYLVDGKRVHRLVAQKFVHNPRPDIFKLVDHINRDRGDNRAVNLRWVNHHLNMLNRSNPAGKVLKVPNPKRRDAMYVRERCRSWRMHERLRGVSGKQRLELYERLMAEEDTEDMPMATMPVPVRFKWKRPPYKVHGFPGVTSDGWFETEEETTAYLHKCREDRFNQAYAGYLASPPRFKEAGTQTDEKRLQ